MDPIWISLLLAIFFSAVFSGMEIAFISANRLKIELDKKQGKYAAKILSNFLKSPAKFIGTMLLGNNVALVIYGILMAKILQPLINYYSSNEFLTLLLQTIISTLLVLFFAEFFPKAILRKNPNRVLLLAAIPLQIIYYILYPFTYITVGISNLILKLFKIDTSESDMAFSRIDLEHFVIDIQDREEEGEEIDHEIHIFKNALDFSDVKARECMVPRTEVITINIEDTLENLQNKFIETGLSKILVYRGSIDNIIGYIHSKELFKIPTSIKSILLPVSIFPEAMLVSEILQQFIKQRSSVAVVVDEFGGTSGILTTEDIIEEIFGEIEDEHDKEELVEDNMGDGEYRFSARVEIDDINEKYKLSLPESDEYETLAGLVIHAHESIPEKGEVIELEDFVLTIDAVSNNRIEMVHLKVKGTE